MKPQAWQSRKTHLTGINYHPFFFGSVSLQAVVKNIIHGRRTVESVVHLCVTGNMRGKAETYTSGINPHDLTTVVLPKKILQINVSRVWWMIRCSEHSNCYLDQMSEGKQKQSFIHIQRERHSVLAEMLTYFRIRTLWLLVFVEELAWKASLVFGCCLQALYMIEWVRALSP